MEGEISLSATSNGGPVLAAPRNPHLRRAHTMTTIDDPIRYGRRFLLSKFDLNNNSDPKNSNEDEKESDACYSESFVWDWPFCEDRIAKGFLTKEKFVVCLPFSKGGTGESKGTTKKFEKISESGFSWSVGLCSNIEGGTCFWRIEIETIKNLNMLVLIASRDVSRPDESSKRLKRVRKVYRLPHHYDISTLTTASYDWAIMIEVYRRVDVRTQRPVPMQRADTFT